MSGHTTYCENCCYYDHSAQVCENPHGPYGEDCHWGEKAGFNPLILLAIGAGLVYCLIVYLIKHR